jgi:5'(3')-deoxyribonucleotidase
MRLPIGIDLDGVVADFVGGWIGLMTKQFPGWDPPTEADITDWDFLDKTVFGQSGAAWGSFWSWAAQERLFSKLDPYPGAVEAIREIGEHSDVVFITARPVWACEDTLRWLDRMGLGRFTVCFNGDKTSIPCSVYIEDAPHFLVQYDRERPKAVTFRMVRPWNSPTAGARDLDGWGGLAVERILFATTRRVIA